VMVRLRAGTHNLSSSASRQAVPAATTVISIYELEAHCATCSMCELCEDGEVCVLPFERLDELAHELPLLHIGSVKTADRFEEQTCTLGGPRTAL
jgi:hypothetical protein